MKNLMLRELEDLPRAKPRSITTGREPGVGWPEASSHDKNYVFLYRSSVED